MSVSEAPRYNLSAGNTDEIQKQSCLEASPRWSGAVMQPRYTADKMLTYKLQNSKSVKRFSSET